jgi:sugar/nucleoside kinase (ribokinase family)
MVAAASVLGMRSAFMGKVGRDANGELFEADLAGFGVDQHLFKADVPTGSTMLFQGDDANTFIVSIGAAGEFSASEVSAEMFRGYDYLHMEGFLLNSGDVAFAALEYARAAGSLISFDLGSKGLIARHRGKVEQIVSQYADIVFANEFEALEFTGMQPREAVVEIAGRLASRNGIAVVKCGAEGSFIARGEELYKIGAIEVAVEDTVGAGDAYAAGFIYARSLGCSLEECGKKAATTAAAAVAVKGPRIHRDQLPKISSRNFAV